MEIFKNIAKNKESMEKTKIAGISEPSPLHPDKNEDSFFIDANEQIAGIFDGVGGYGGGDIASRIASEYILKEMQNLPKNLDVEEIKNRMSKILFDASEKILDEIKKNSKLKKMRTTATVIKICENKKTGKKMTIIGNSGDSRAYLLRDDKLKRITKDDSYVQFLINNGALNEDDDQNVEKVLPDDVIMKNSSLETGDTIGHIRNGITKALGMRKGIYSENSMPAILAIEIEKDDKILLSTDGIHDNLLDEQIEKILKHNETPIELSRKLTQLTKAMETDYSNPRSKPDDKTAIVLEI